MTTPPSSLPPANWYPDPQTPGQLRYWDGQKWTQHVHPAAQPAQGVGGAGQAQGAGLSTGTFMPSGRPGGGAAPGAGGQAGGGSSGGPTFSPTGATAAGPATGSQRTFQPGAAVTGSPAEAGAPGAADEAAPSGQAPHDSVDWVVPTGRPIQAFLAGIFGFLALVATAASVYGLDTGYDDYITYAAGGLGFLAVLFGFAGLSKANRGEHGRGPSYFGIIVGFLCVGLNAYEAFYPRELWGYIEPYLPS